jgi:prepilin-type processing-associated H-X9-DG protein
MSASETNKNKKRGCGPLTWGCIVLPGLALLAFLLFGGMPDGGGPANNVARRDTCQTFLKELGQALRMYSDENFDTLPSSAVVSNSRTWNKKDFLAFAGFGAAASPKAHSMTMYEAMKPYFRLREMPKCHEDYSDLPSYCWRIAVDKAWYGVGCSKPCRSPQDYRYPAKSILLYERLPWHVTDRFGWFYQDLSKGLANGARINVVYLDGHVSFITIANATSGNPKSCIAADDGEPMYFNYDNQKHKSASNPPAPTVPAKYTDPQRYSDSLE